MSYEIKTRGFLESKIIKTYAQFYLIFDELRSLIIDENTSTAQMVIGIHRNLNNIFQIGNLKREHDIINKVSLRIKHELHISNDEYINELFIECYRLADMYKLNVLNEIRENMRVDSGPSLPYRLPAKTWFGVINQLYLIHNNIYRWPVEYGRITSVYGRRIRNGEIRFHYGIDIAGDQNQNIFPIASGIVIETGDNDRVHGMYVKVQHSNGYTSKYSHLSSRNINNDTPVEYNTELGLMGTTGESTGIHLHFEVRDKNNRYLNPLSILPRRPYSIIINIGTPRVLVRRDGSLYNEIR